MRRPQLKLGENERISRHPQTPKLKLGENERVCRHRLTPSWEDTARETDAV